MLETGAMPIGKNSPVESGGMLWVVDGHNTLSQGNKVFAPLLAETA